MEFDPAIAQVRDFVGAIEDLGFGVPEKEAPADAAEQGYRRRLLVAAIFAAPVMVLGMSHGASHVPYSPWIQLALTLPVMLYSGAPFYVAAWNALRHRAANMNSLISLGTGAAFLYSLVETVRGRHEVYYEAAAVDHHADPAGPHAGSARPRPGLRGHPPTDGPAAAGRARAARWRRNRDVRWSRCCVGDILVVRPGERIAVDGEVTRGRVRGGRVHADRREHARRQAPGRPRCSPARSICSGAFRYRATKVGRGTMLQQMMELVKQAQGSRAPVARLADVVSGYFTVGVLVVALRDLRRVAVFRAVRRPPW